VATEVSSKFERRTTCASKSPETGESSMLLATLKHQLRVHVHTSNNACMHAQVCVCVCVCVCVFVCECVCGPVPMRVRV
jgi:hypothetical protein